jgi:hypothetical protein
MSISSTACDDQRHDSNNHLYDHPQSAIEAARAYDRVACTIPNAPLNFPDAVRPEAWALLELGRAANPGDKPQQVSIIKIIIITVPISSSPSPSPSPSGMGGGL